MPAANISVVNIPALNVLAKSKSKISVNKNWLLDGF